MSDKELEKTGDDTQKPIVAVSLSGLGDDTMLYQKVDVARVCRLGDDFAVSFFQVNYQTAVDLAVSGTKETLHAKVNPVTKVVMNKTGFEVLLNQMLEVSHKVGINVKRFDKV